MGGEAEAKPKYVVSSTRKDFPWTNSHHIADDLRTGVQRLKDATPAGVLLGSGKLATELGRLDLIGEYKLLVHPRITGHGPTLYQGGLLNTRRLERSRRCRSAMARSPRTTGRTLTRSSLSRTDYGPVIFRGGEPQGSLAPIIGSWRLPETGRSMPTCQEHQPSALRRRS
ncbi:dihydrofolate reductase family protein [Boseaceae bacterium BT-24-1]|nr:dihydrofolate reductase family protein [Boseaceae bacterium BT-24-1]